jgi:hypothetical protein
VTNLKRPVKRVCGKGLVREQGRQRAVVIILRPPNILGFRAKGCRKEYQLTADVCYTMAVRAAVLAKKKERKRKRKAKRGL